MDGAILRVFRPGFASVWLDPMTRRPMIPPLPLVADPPAAGPVAQRGGRQGWLFLGLFAVVLLAYWPALRGGFLWDDDGHVTASELRSLHGLARIWFEPGATQQYYPVLHSAFWLEHRLWGDEVMGYHLVNVCLHALAAGLLGLVLRQLTVPGAWLAAFLFALHPVQVESVAWISEQKNTLSGVFYLAAALVFLRFDASRRWQSYALATFLFVLAVLSKSVTATLPAALAVVLWWGRGRLEWRRDMLPLAPWLVIGLAVGLFTMWVERHFIGAAGATFELTWPERLFLAGRAPWFYLGKLLWPAHLVFVYPRWELAGFAHGACLLALVLAGWLAWRRRRSRRGPLAVMLFFVGTLFPVLGFFNVFPFIYSFVADHFQYLASIGIIAGVAALAVDGMSRLTSGRLAAAQVAVGGVVALLAALTFRQSRNYRDPETFYAAILAANPEAWLAQNNLGAQYVVMGQTARALPFFREALRLNPRFDQARGNLGSALVELGQFAAAVPLLTDAVRDADPRLTPNLTAARANLGVALMHVGRVDEAIPILRRAVASAPDLPEAQNALGFALEQTGAWPEAELAYRRALETAPRFGRARLNLAGLLARRQRTDEALAEYRRGVELDPGSAEAQRGLAIMLLFLDRASEALGPAEALVRIAPSLPDAQRLLADVLVKVGRVEDGVTHYREALRLAPELSGIHADLAGALLLLGRNADAFAECEEALRVKSDDAAALRVLGELRAGKGRR